MAIGVLRYGNTAIREYTNGGSAVVAGTVVILDDNRIGIVVSALAANQKGAVYIDGVFDITSATGSTITIGAACYIDIDVSNSVITSGSAATGDVLCGTAMAAKISGQLVATVDLNAKVGTVT